METNPPKKKQCTNKQLANDPISIYQKLGVKTIINASGTFTAIGGSCMPNEVLTAMARAGQQFVHVDELYQKAGDYIANKIGVPAALITSGAGAAEQLAMAACLTGDDEHLIQQLPFLSNTPDKIDPRSRIVLLPQCGISDVPGALDEPWIKQILRATGAIVKMCGTTSQCLLSDYRAAIEKIESEIQISTFWFFLGPQTKDDLSDVVHLAKEYGSKVIIDAAAMLPPRSNLWELVKLGADVAIFSGGKGIRGPQTTGLAVGKKDIINAMRLNMSPRDALGRTFKVGKEECAALVAAIDLYLAKTDEEELTEWNKRCTFIKSAIEGESKIDKVMVVRNEKRPKWDSSVMPDFCPRVYIRMHSVQDATVLQKRLLEGPHSVRVREGSAHALHLRDKDDTREADQWIIADVMTLKDWDEVQKVASAIAQELVQL